ncbi:MAG: OmpA family protein [Bacteroidetes bacterium]|nr:MAG: OmpA family protein [Bacteroidota bacterium]
MRIFKYSFLVVLCSLCVLSEGYSQGWAGETGIGAGFGFSAPQTTVKGPKYKPYSHIFIRYYPEENVAIQTGFGLAYLEAERNSNFFQSLIVPIDIRLLFHPARQGKMGAYLFAGIGATRFDPKNQADKSLLNGEQWMAEAPVGGGLQWWFATNTAAELSGAYHFGFTDNLDAVKTGTNDSYWSVSLNFFAFLRGEEIGIEFRGESADRDMDGLSLDEERRYGTDPNSSDTDGDGLTDGEEVHTYQTDPTKADTDGDGLTDKEEIFTYKTNPLNKDADGDGLSDGDEILKYGTNMLKADTDGDGLSDGEEVLTYHSNPTKVDTDGDGLTDFEEVNKYRTDPTKADTDGDGLSDYDEINKYHTNPLFADTDEGGMEDGKEVELGLNPLNPKDDIPTISFDKAVIFPKVQFITGSAGLTNDAKKTLDKVVATLLLNPNIQVAIYGHADRRGTASFNLKLSKSRAESVKNYLAQKGVKASRITTKGFGYTRPIADNTTPEGLAKNRRIEFIRIK